MPSTDSRLSDNLIYFCRTLRRAGVPVGSAQLLDATRAVEAVGFKNRQDFRATLRACLITRPEHLDVFEQSFGLFWRDPEFLERMVSNLLPVINAPLPEKKAKPAAQRAADAMLGNNHPGMQREPKDEITLDAQFSFSNVEKLKTMDFDVMSNAEIREAEHAIARLELPVPLERSRRYQSASSGASFDPRLAARLMRRNGGELPFIPKRQPAERPSKLILLCDISGSMSTYARMMMRFIHALFLANSVELHAFTLGTQLSNISRLLRIKDPDAALMAIGQQVKDWDGGTRLGGCLKEFNFNWSRRIPSSGATVILISDGLERSDNALLESEIQRLHRSVRQLIWLNPLLRWDQFEPKAQGIRTILPNVDRFLACHSLESMKELVGVLNQKP